jgi:hypothetical protein
MIEKFPGEKPPAERFFSQTQVFKIPFFVQAFVANMPAVVANMEILAPAHFTDSQGFLHTNKPAGIIDRATVIDRYCCTRILRI